MKEELRAGTCRLFLDDLFPFFLGYNYCLAEQAQQHDEKKRKKNY